jgi:hypothetical protein
MHPDSRSESSTAHRIERRARHPRRRRPWWSLFYGSFRPRRRAPARRSGELQFVSVDWFAARLLAAALGISLLSIVDAFLTLQLLANGADEINPVMAALLFHGVAAFTASKIGVTCLCVVALVCLSSHRFMRLVRVEAMLYVVLAGYVTLVGYELWLLRGTVNLFNL